MKVSKAMFGGALFFCLLAFAPHLLHVYYDNAFLMLITSQMGWYAYLLFAGLITSLIVGLFDPRFKRNMSELDQEKENSSAP